MNKRYSLLPNKVPEGAEWVKREVEGEESMFSYFDKELMRQWTGPEHYIGKRVKRTPFIFNMGFYG